MEKEWHVSADWTICGIARPINSVKGFSNNRLSKEFGFGHTISDTTGMSAALPILERISPGHFLHQGYGTLNGNLTLNYAPYLVPFGTILCHT